MQQLIFKERLYKSQKLASDNTIMENYKACTMNMNLTQIAFRL